MKNDSFLFPFGLPGDGIFDSNHDGKLTEMETAFRDATIMTILDYLFDEIKEDTDNSDESDDAFDSVEDN